MKVSRNNTSGNPNAETETILIVDDEASQRRLLSAILGERGYRILESETGEDALHMAAEHKPRLIILDVMLPTISGIEVCRRIRSDPELTHTTLLLISSVKRDSQDLATGLDDGADGYIVRPIPNRELLARIESALRRSRVEERLRRERDALEEALSRQTGFLADLGTVSDRGSQGRGATEQRLEEMAEWRESLVAAIPGPVYRSDASPPYTPRYFSEGIQDLTGYAVEDFASGRVSYDSLILPEDLPEVTRLTPGWSLNLVPFACQYRIRNAAGDVRWVEERGRVSLVRDSVSRTLDGVIFDVTDRRLTDERMEAYLKEREVLLREVHHRVKNNLAVISALLGAQSYYAGDEALKKKLEASQDRILSMALAHDLLCRSENLAYVKMSRYIESLLSRLIISSAVVGSQLEVVKDIEDISLDLDFAVPLGSLLTELVSNSLRHAFAGREQGEIRVVFHSADEEHYELIVADNGVGIPEDVDPGSPESSGLELAAIFADKLGGEIQFGREEGTEVRVKFPKPHAAEG